MLSRIPSCPTPSAQINAIPQTTPAAHYPAQESLTNNERLAAFRIPARAGSAMGGDNREWAVCSNVAVELAGLDNYDKWPPVTCHLADQEAIQQSEGDDNGED